MGVGERVRGRRRGSRTRRQVDRSSRGSGTVCAGGRKSKPQRKMGELGRRVGPPLHTTPTDPHTYLRYTLVAPVQRRAHRSARSSAVKDVVCMGGSVLCGWVSLWGWGLSRVTGGLLPASGPRRASLVSGGGGPLTRPATQGPRKRTAAATKTSRAGYNRRDVLAYSLSEWRFDRCPPMLLPPIGRATRLGGGRLLAAGRSEDGARRKAGDRMISVGQSSPKFPTAGCRGDRPVASQSFCCVM